MDVEQALAVVWREAARSSQAEVAKAIGVSGATLTGWKSGVAPSGKRLHQLLEWAEGRPAPAPLPEVLRAAQERTEANLTRLAEVTGYARAVWHMMQTVTDQQGDVVRALEPWSTLETDTMRKIDEQAAVEITKRAAARVRNPPTTDE